MTVASSSSPLPAHDAVVPESNSLQKTAPQGLENPILHTYFVGQIFNAVKAAIWWAGFSPLIFAAFNNRSYLVGVARVLFNLSLFVVSPVAGAYIDRLPVRRVLLGTALGRGLIYVVLLPLAWATLSAGFYDCTDVMQYAFVGVFCLLVLFDGAMVAFTNICDIDMGGTDLVGAQHNVEITDELRGKFNARHTLAMEAGMVVFFPVMAGLSYLATTKLHVASITPDQLDTLALMAAMAIAFLVTTLGSLVAYTRIPSYRVQGADAARDKDATRGDSADGSGDGASTEQGHGLCGVLYSVWAGVRAIWRHRALRARILFFSLEVALEDAFVSLMIAEFAEAATPAGDTHFAEAALLTAGIAAVGKVGGVLAGAKMDSFFNQQQELTEAVRPLFKYALLGGLSTVLFPVAWYVRTHEASALAAEGHGHGLSLALVMVGAFAFFFFAGICKIGFMNLMQSLVMQTGEAGAIFGSIGTFVMATDSLVVMGLSALFSAVDLQWALAAGSGLAVLYGLVNFVWGPALVLAPQQPRSLHQGLLD